MLTQKQIDEIREHLQKAQSPLFYYDNDADGLCSYVILRKFLGRGKGVAIKSYPDLNAQYAERARDLCADYVFILDKPLVSRAFFEEIDKLGLPIVWIDHHNLVDERVLEGMNNVYVYNPALNSGKDKSNEPVTYLSYCISGRTQDMWVAMMGCIADHFLPDFTSDFANKYPNLWKEQVTEPFDAYYRTEIGNIAQAVGFGLKDSLSNVVALQGFLIACKTPDEVFIENEYNYTFLSKIKDIRKKYSLLIEEAKQQAQGPLLFFSYGGELSISSEIANELCYTYPDKYILVAYLKASIANLSLRGKGVLKIVQKILKDFPNASGGGHDDAVGARMRTEDLPLFEKALRKEVEND